MQHGSQVSKNLQTLLQLVFMFHWSACFTVGNNTKWGKGETSRTVQTPPMAIEVKGARPHYRTLWSLVHFGLATVFTRSCFQSILTAWAEWQLWFCPQPNGKSESSVTKADWTSVQKTIIWEHLWRQGCVQFSLFWYQVPFEEELNYRGEPGTLRNGTCTTLPWPWW